MKENRIICSVRNAEKSYGNTRVLGPVCLELKAGEITGIFGNNGAGKTTLIELIAGVISPSAGKVHIEKNTVKAYVPQEIALYGGLNGRQNLEFWADTYGLKGEQKKLRINWLLREVKLEDKAEKKLRTYSGGMKRRLNLAVALLVKPDILLLDEPFAGTDESSAELIRSIILNTAKRGCSIVLIDHDRKNLAQLCGRVIELSFGRIVSEV